MPTGCSRSRSRSTSSRPPTGASRTCSVPTQLLLTPARILRPPSLNHKHRSPAACAPDRVRPLASLSRRRDRRTSSVAPPSARPPPRRCAHARATTLCCASSRRATSNGWPDSPSRVIARCAVRSTMTARRASMSTASRTAAGSALAAVAAAPCTTSRRFCGASETRGADFARLRSELRSVFLAQ